MNPELLAQLRDIQGLDTIPWWPLASGWWLLGGLLLVVLYLLYTLVRNLFHYPAGSWHRDAWKQLRRLKQQLPRLPAREVAGDLSELIRRIAVARFGREEAAALTGESWLEWLKMHDPAGFDWRTRGELLLTLPYAPPGDEQLSADQLRFLIDAALVWTDRRRRFGHA
jgi:hypothetical protein